MGYSSGSQTSDCIESPEGSVKAQIAGLFISRISDSVGLGWGPRTCVSNKFTGNADTADTTLRTWAKTDHNPVFCIHLNWHFQLHYPTLDWLTFTFLSKLS